MKIYLFKAPLALLQKLLAKVVAARITELVST